MTEEHVDAANGAAAEADAPDGSGAPPDGAGGRNGDADPARRRPERPGMAGLLETLSVRRNALVGVGVGVALAVVVYLVRALELLGPATGTREYPVLGADGYFFMLAVVLAAATTLFVAALLTVVAAVRAIRSSPE